MSQDITSELASRQQDLLFPKMSSATSPMALAYIMAASLSSAGMSFQQAFGVSSLQYAGKHFEIPSKNIYMYTQRAAQHQMLLSQIQMVSSNATSSKTVL